VRHSPASSVDESEKREMESVKRVAGDRQRPRMESPNSLSFLPPVQTLLLSSSSTIYLSSLVLCNDGGTEYEYEYHIASSPSKSS